MKRFIFTAVVFSLLFGCIQLNDFTIEETRPLIFQYEYINYAWGYNHNGWIMESSGEVKRFQKNAKWVFPDSLDYITETDMKKNILACDSVMANVTPATFSLYAQKAFACSNGTMTKPTNIMADAGEQIYCFYLYDASGKRYKRFILNMRGDWSQENLAPYSNEVVEWMKSIK